jgi:hypothetical protein
MDNKLSIPAYLGSLALLVACAVIPVQAADNAAPASAGLQPVFHYSATASEPIIEYNLVHGMLAQPDPVPLLRVYGNGRVHVHFPAYMKKTGDYEMNVSPVELNELIRLLADDGIMDFDPHAARQEKQQLEAARRAATGELFHVSDATDTVINVRLSQYQRAAASPRINQFHKRFRWRNLDIDARRYPESNRIMRAASAAANLRALCSHPGLQKLP